MMASNNAFSEHESSAEAFIGEPLDTMMIQINSKNGVKKMVPAMSIGFMENRSYVHFKTPPVPSDTGQQDLEADEEEWLECMYFIEDDLSWLLKLPYYRFWSQVIYDEKLHKFLESYLSQAPRSHDLIGLHLKEEHSSVLKKIHKLVFLVYLRMSTYKESKENHMRPEVFGQIIYDHFIFDIPKIMDLCILYGIQNKQLLNKMINNIFTNQPNYFSDLSEVSRVTIEAFNIAEEKLLHGDEKESYRLEDNVPLKSKNLPISAFSDMINYVTDTAATLYAFLEVYSAACDAFFQNNFLTRIATFYEQVYPVIEKEIYKCSKQNYGEKRISEFKKKVMLSKTLLIKTFRNILDHCCIQCILNSACDKNTSTENYSETFLATFTEIAPDKNFLQDYNSVYPFEDDLELLREMEVFLDPERIGYVFSSIYDSPEMLHGNYMSSIENGARPKESSLEYETQAGAKSLHSIAAILKPDNSTAANENDSSQPDNVNGGLNEFEMNFVIQAVRDVLPDYKEGFVEKCLQHYEYDPEKVIDAILTDSLPPELNKLDRNLERNASEEPKIQDSILSERRCVYDNDEFDIFSREDVNLKNIHIGKKNKTPDDYQALEKNKESEFLKQLIVQYTSEDAEYSEDVYEDEYDDTYDSAMVGLKEPEVESDSVKFCLQPESTGVRHAGDDDEQSDGDEESEADSLEVRSKPGDFCVNPEILRANYDRRRQAQMAARNKHRGDSNPENQGQSRLQHKDRNKAYIGNHNRRKQSDFKKSRGMYS